MLEAPLKATHFCYSGPGADEGSLLSRYGQYGGHFWPSGCTFQLSIPLHNSSVADIAAKMLILQWQSLEQRSAFGKTRPEPCAVCGAMTACTGEPDADTSCASDVKSPGWIGLQVCVPADTGCVRGAQQLRGRSDGCCPGDLQRHPAGKRASAGVSSAVVDMHHLQPCYGCSSCIFGLTAAQKSGSEAEAALLAHTTDVSAAVGLPSTHHWQKASVDPLHFCERGWILHAGCRTTASNCRASAAWQPFDAAVLPGKHTCPYPGCPGHARLTGTSTSGRIICAPVTPYVIPQKCAEN